MMMTRNSVSLSALLLAGIGGALALRAESLPAPLQVQGQTGAFPEFPSGSTSDLVMRTFRPASAPVGELFPVAQNFVGRTLVLTSQGSSNPVRQHNLQRLGNTILIYDLPNNIESTLNILKRLDETFAADGANAEGEERIVREYQARFLPLNTLMESLEPYLTQVFDANRQGVPSRARRNVTPIEERGVLVLHDTPGRVEELLEHIAKLDVQSPQVMLSCYLVRTSQEAPAEGSALPNELVAGMRSLTGAPHLERVAFGLVRSSVGSSAKLSIVLQTADTGTFLLEVLPAAYDPGTSTLSMTSCRLRSEGGGSFPANTTLFTTTAAVTSGEYTVIGAAGATPLFVVLRCQPL